MRRLIVVSVFVVCAYAGAALVHAALPALAAWAWAVDTVGTVAVQSVGRQAVLAVGVAANDAAFVSTASSWASQAIAGALLLLPWNNGGQVEVPVSAVVPEADKTKPAPVNVQVMTQETKIATYGVTIPPPWCVTGQACSAGATAPEAQSYSALVAAFVADFNAKTVSDYHIVAEDVSFVGDFLETEGAYRKYIWLHISKLDAAFDEWAGGGGYEFVVYANVLPQEPKDQIRRTLFANGGWMPDSTDPDWTGQELASWNTAKSILTSEANKAVSLKQVAGAVALDVRMPVSNGMEQQSVAFDAQGVPVSSGAARDTGPLIVFVETSSGGSSSGSAAVCGGPGLPACAVKVDETGVPTGGTFTASGTMDAITNAATQQIANAGNKTELPFAWAPSFPTGVCEDVSFNVHGMTTTVDWCQYLGMLRSLIAWLYGLLTSLYVWRKVTEAY